MKKELLKISDLSCEDSQGVRLDRTTMYGFAGERIGLLGLSRSGKDFLMQILKGATDQNLELLNIYVDKKKITDPAVLRKLGYRIHSDNYRIPDWTVAEYIGLIEGRWLQLAAQRREVIRSAKEGFDRLGLSMDVNRRMSDLTEIEKRMVDVVRAGSRGVRLLFVEDEFEGMRRETIETFGDFLQKAVEAYGCCALISSHSLMVMSALSDRYVIFRHGHIVKKCQKEQIRDNEHLGSFLLGSTMGSRKKSLDRYIQEQIQVYDETSPGVYRAKNLRLKGGRKADLVFRKGMITVLLALNDREREDIFMNISGRHVDRCEPWVEDRPVLNPEDPLEYIRHKVVSVRHMGSREEIFSHMTVGENLLLPSLSKISSSEYVLYEKKLIALANGNPEILQRDTGEILDQLDIDERIAVILERWYLFNPKVLVLYEPFAQCDMYGVSIVRSYIRKFANRGTAVIIIKSREEYVEDIADEMISME